MRAGAAVLLVLALGAGACSDAEPSELAVRGTEMAFEAPDTVAAGAHSLVFTNAGLEHHEVAVSDATGKVLGRVSAGPGATKVLDVELRPGRYELGCFEPGHYEAGMHQPLMVT